MRNLGVLEVETRPDERRELKKWRHEPQVKKRVKAATAPSSLSREKKENNAPPKCDTGPEVRLYCTCDTRPQGGLGGSGRPGFCMNTPHFDTSHPQAAGKWRMWDALQSLPKSEQRPGLQSGRSTPLAGGARIGESRIKNAKALTQIFPSSCWLHMHRAHRPMVAALSRTLQHPAGLPHLHQPSAEELKAARAMEIGYTGLETGHWLSSLCMCASFIFDSFQSSDQSKSTISG